MDFFSHRADERFTFRLVERPGWDETESLAQITGGEIELSALSDLKVAGTLRFEGSEVPDDSIMVRVYYGFADEEGESDDYPLATLLADASEPVFDGATASGSLDCYSVLKVLSDRLYGMPFTVPAGTQAVQMAIHLTESLGLRVNNPDPSAYTVKSDHTFDDDASYLEIVNWLLSAAGFASCWPDPYGIVQMCEYVEPTEREPVMEFRDDEHSIMYPEVSPTDNFGSLPNVCRLSFEADEKTYWAVARNADPASPASTVSRGREVTVRDAVSELDGETDEDRIANLASMARKKLVDNSALVSYVDFAHAWVPIFPNDAIEVRYVSAGLEWSGTVSNMRIELTESVPCQTSARRFARVGFKIETEGGVV